MPSLGQKHSPTPPPVQRRLSTRDGKIGFFLPLARVALDVTPKVSGSCGIAGDRGSHSKNLPDRTNRATGSQGG